MLLGALRGAVGSLSLGKGTAQRAGGRAQRHCLCKGLRVSVCLTWLRNAGVEDTGVLGYLKLIW